MAGQGWSNISTSAIHYLLRVCNQEIFEFITPSDKDVFHHFWMIFKSQQVYLNKVGSLLDMTYSLHHISWLFPSGGWVKLNCDGFVNQHSRASYSGLMRDSLGHFIHDFTVNLGICPITVAKI